MRISFVIPAWRPPDAISYCLSARIDALKGLFGPRLEARVYTRSSNATEAPVRLVNGPWDLVRDAFFHSSDLVVAEFGGHDTLFDFVFFATMPTLAVYHNVTPERLFPPGAMRDFVRRGRAQRSNLFEFTHVLCDSEFNRQDLLELGMPAERLDVLAPPLKRGHEPVPPAPLSDDAPIELLFVGRCVPSKGLADAVRSVLLAAELGLRPCRLSLIGNPEFGDAEYFGEVKRLIAGTGHASWFRWVGAVSEEHLRAEYLGANVLVIPSYHEGFCLPVAEALAGGCFVSGYAAGSVADTAGGLARLVPAGGWPALGVALSALGEELRAMTEEARAAYYERARASLVRFTFERFRDGMRHVLATRLGFHA